MSVTPRCWRANWIRNEKIKLRTEHSVCVEVDGPCPCKKTQHTGKQASKEFVPHTQRTGTQDRQRKLPLHFSTHQPSPIESQKWDNVPGRP